MPQNLSWRSTPAEAPATPPRRAGPSLTVAVAAIVAVAAQRARGAGMLDALREAVLAALDTADQAAPSPRPAPDAAPPDAAPDAAVEDARFRALFGGATPR
jgi:hypothetical protein